MGIENGGVWAIDVRNKRNEACNCKCKDFDVPVTVYQFELLSKGLSDTYKTFEKDVTRCKVQKKCNRTKRVVFTIMHKEIYKKLSAIKKLYIMHKYQVNNDIYEWPLTLFTTNAHGLVLHHMDFFWKP